MSDEPPRFDPAGFAELPDKLALGQLPPGRHGLPRSFVVRNQRLRIVAGLLRVLPRHGYAETTIGQIIARGRRLPGRLLQPVRRQGGVLPGGV